ncbi:MULTISPECIES: low temperature requirement protein A [unclassified Achromobacter]|uniref:low temperature requirement protein A n=1 Tax=unclassified Achromobacter TaxID=2626865 RepID=UPI0018E91A5A|nr:MULTISPECIES: low temperature requirement protein A [unclassified Achromobacter]
MDTDASSPAAAPLHRLRRMAGHDPHERHRTATPLEGLFDLTFATCFGLAAAQLAHALAQGHFGTALIGFGFASFAICWAWINFSWFSSAYDTDDWIFRLVTMVQMVGVLVLATGLPRLFDSVDKGAHLDDTTIVLGYVIMRVAMVMQWLRAARQDPPRRRACLTYATAIAIAQVGWIVQIILDTSIVVTLLFAAVLAVIELAGPVIAERIGDGTPWHAHHIAERYSLFALIALGEGVVGTIAGLAAVVEVQGWSLDAGLVCLAGIGLTFGMWWIYYLLPSAEVLYAHRDRSFVWGYGQIFIVAAIVATGAGLHVAAYAIEHESHIGALPTVLCSAIPVGLFLVLVHALHTYLVPRSPIPRSALLAGNLAFIAVALLAAAFGASIAACLVILMLGPALTVVGTEVLGRRQETAASRKAGLMP